MSQLEISNGSLFNCVIFADATIFFDGSGPFTIEEDGSLSVAMVLVATELAVPIDVELTGMSGSAGK